MKVSFKNVSFKYDEDSIVLKDFNLTINDGEMVAILGHNGSGKSTVAKIIMGLLEINSGEIYINDKLLNQEFGEYAVSRQVVVVSFQSI